MKRRFVEKITRYDVLLLQETKLVEDLEETLALPPGYKAFYQSRPTAEKDAGGGVAALVRDDLPCTKISAMSSADMLVIDIGFAVLVCAYIIPHGSPWHDWADSEPMQRLEETVAVLAAGDKPFFLLGDITECPHTITTRMAVRSE